MGRISRSAKMKLTTPPKLIPPFHSTAASGTLPIEQTKLATATTGPTSGPHSMASSGLDRDAHARSRAIPAADLLAFLRAKHPVRDKTLWWLLYESAARAGEVLALDIDDLDLPRRRAVVIGKGGRAELIGWETRTARLLPRHLAGREQGPLFLTDLAPAPARQPAAADLDPASGHARLSYRRAGAGARSVRNSG